MSSYLAESTLRAADGGSWLLLESALGATPHGLVQNPSFFRGFAVRPDVMANALLAVADVAASRYFDAAFRLSDVLDPVMTAGGDRLRCESFSACNGVYARLDLLASGLDGGEIGFGTTNVDINAALRSALANVHRNELLHFAVGRDGLLVSTPAESHFERKVELPDRWVRGFAETPGIAAEMSHVATLSGAATAQFLSSLPSARPGRTLVLLPSARGFREVTTARPHSVTLAGTGRLAAARRVARFATSVDIFKHAGGSSAWAFQLPGAHFTLLLSPAPTRGFSGEGGILESLAEPGAEAAGEAVLEFLSWQSVVSAGELLTRTKLAAPHITQGLAYLGASGKVGFDLLEGEYFHRELPLDRQRTVKDYPRLAAARSIVAAGGVVRREHWWEVCSATGNYAYRIRRTDGSFRCNCPWWTDNQGSRGPCKHVLAVRLLLLEAGGIREGGPYGD
ncbi:MAG: SWIM zinc finger family protein [Arthrobacter sp.]